MTSNTTGKNAGRHLRALPSALGDPQGAPSAAKKDVGSSHGRQYAPHAPLSPGSVPHELARSLRTHEPVVWWNEKNSISWRAVAYTFALGAACLAAVTLFAPEFWQQPLARLWKPAFVPFLPSAMVLARETLSRRSILVTDTSVLEVGWRGDRARLAFRNIRRVRRDILTGGILLEGKQHRVRIPPSLLEDAQAAIASQTKHTLGSGDTTADDPTGWFPR